MVEDQDETEDRQEVEAWNSDGFEELGGRDGRSRDGVEADRREGSLGRQPHGGRARQQHSRSYRMQYMYHCANFILEISFHPSSRRTSS